MTTTIDSSRSTSMNPEPRQAGSWLTLFDGSNVEEWRAYRRPRFPDTGWAIREGCLCHLPQVESIDLITKRKFSDFELTLEWKISRAGNSGILYRVSEDEDASWKTGPEIQLLDDEFHPDGKNPLTSAGALYGLMPPKNASLAPVGEFNHLRLIADGPRVEHWLNGAKVLEYEIDSPEWTALVQKSKFAEQPGFGRQREGHIVLQDHRDGACFRNIRIRELR